MSSCSHSHPVYCDASTLVCCECGLVLNTHEMISHSFFPTEDIIETRPTPSRPRKRKSYLTPRQIAVLEGKDLIRSVVADAHLGELVLDWAIQVFEDSTEVRDSKNRFQGYLGERCASSLYFACKLVGFDRSEEEVASWFDLDLKSLRKQNILVRRLLTGTCYGIELLTCICPTKLSTRLLDAILNDPSYDTSHVPKYRVLEEVNCIIRASDTGKKPRNICAHALYQTLKKFGVTVHQISSTIGVGQATIKDG